MSNMEQETAEEKANREAAKASDNFESELEEITNLYKEQFLSVISIIGEVQSINATKNKTPRVEMSNAKPPLLTEILDNTETDYLVVNPTRAMSRATAKKLPLVEYKLTAMKNQTIMIAKKEQIYKKWQIN